MGVGGKSDCHFSEEDVFDLEKPRLCGIGAGLFCGEGFKFCRSFQS